MLVLARSAAAMSLAAALGWPGAAQAADVGPAVVGDPVVLAESDAISGIDQFGATLAISGDLLVVGAPEDATARPGQSGAAYIYERSEAGWVRQAKVLPRSGVHASYFGDAVAISGETILVASPYEATAGERGGGSVYVYEQVDGQWVRTGLLLSPDPSVDDDFGHALVADGPTLAIGDSRHRKDGEDVPTVDIFVRTDAGWVFQSELQGQHPTGYESFGDRVALDGDTIFVSASHADTVRNDAGAVYVYTRDADTWRPTAKLTEPGLMRNSYFGTAVALDGDRAAVSTSDFVREDKTNVFIYVRSGQQWTLETTLVAPRRQDAFGSELELEGDELLIGAPENYPRPTGGRAFLYHRSGQGWTLGTALRSPQPDQGHAFGGAISVSDDTVAIGDQFDEDGKVYLYDR